MQGVSSFYEQTRLEGRVAIVTGSGRGLGRAMALALADAGADLVLVAKTGTEVEETAQDIEGLGRRALAFRADAAVPEEVEEVVSQSVHLLGKIDILVNHVCASPLGTFHELDLDMWRETVDIQLKSLFLFCKGVGAHMVDRRQGKIINIMSIDGPLEVSTLVAYRASEGGMIHLTKALAAEWERYNIQVNAIGPVVGRRIAAEGAAAVVSGGREATPEELCPLVIYLASSAADILTGETFLLSAQGMDRL
jgi:NAD(P)-dependent dehydrogenase (short-subunit alcohol dehydrogenase family)